MTNLIWNNLNSKKLVEAALAASTETLRVELLKLNSKELRLYLALAPFTREMTVVGRSGCGQPIYKVETPHLVGKLFKGDRCNAAGLKARAVGPLADFVSKWVNENIIIPQIDLWDRRTAHAY